MRLRKYNIGEYWRDFKKQFEHAWISQKKKGNYVFVVIEEKTESLEGQIAGHDSLESILEL